MEALYQQARDTYINTPRIKDQRRIRHALHCEHVERVIRGIADRARTLDIREAVLQAAAEGRDSVVVWHQRGPFGAASQVEREGVVYECKPLPVEFLVRGPREKSGINYFARNGIESLAQALALIFLPFDVKLKAAGSALIVTLSWALSSPTTTRGPDDEDFQVDLETSSESN